jgi:hypothetical protein
MITKAQRDDKVSTKTKPKPYHYQPNQLIERGSQTACNSKLGYYDSYTLFKGSALYPQVVISSLAKWLEKPPIHHSYTSFGVWHRDHYMSLQRPTTGVCHALLPISQQRTPLAPCGLGRSQSMSPCMSQNMIQRMMPIPTQLRKTHNL